MIVPNRFRYFIAVIVGFAFFLITMVIAYQAYPWGSWRGERIYAFKTLKLARENLDIFIQRNGDAPETLLDVYRTDDQLPRDPWNRVLEYQPKKQGYELKSLGSDGKPGGFGPATDLSLNDKWHAVTIPSPLEFVTDCVTTEVWLTATISGLIAVGMMLWTTSTTKTPQLTVFHFLVALVVTVIISWFVGSLLMALKVAPSH